MGIAAVAVAALASCSSGQNGAANGNGPGTVATGTTYETGPAQVDPDGVTNIPADSLQAQVDALPRATLTAEEQAGLIWMREEEKLARDVYAALYDKWSIPIFSNIASAEQTHTDAVKSLLGRYAVADPSAATAAGTFTNPDIQALYTTLVSQGSTSLVDALIVGATIEDLDIADLQARATTTPDIALVYANLEKGSRNHLRAFTKQLASNGATYTPTHITQADYDAIVSSDTERGAGR
jgi:hypothetical protein